MMSPLIVESNNLSAAWAKAFLELRKPGSHIRHPVVITVNNIDTSVGVENLAIRKKLDQFLASHKRSSCKTVAGTIFPSSLWNESLDDQGASLFNRYEKAWPLIKKCPANKYGVYFRRMTSYEARSDQPVNQLKKIIDTYAGGNRRKSALQVSIFDPYVDHTNQRQRGFPCLQQVTFTPLDDDLLSVTGFYAKQLHLEKAYGNYLGLYELGRFMAQQFNRKLSQLTCVASCLQETDIKTSSNALDHFASDVDALLKEIK